MLCGKDKLNGDFLFRTSSLEGGRYIFDHLMDVKSLPVQKKVLGVEFVEREEILGQVCQPLCLK